MSSGWRGNRYPAKNCIDGNVENFCHTAVENQPWLSVEMATAATVIGVEVYNRQCGGAFVCLSRLGNFQVWVGSSESPTFEESPGNTLCAASTSASGVYTAL